VKINEKRRKKKRRERGNKGGEQKRKDWQSRYFFEYVDNTVVVKSVCE